MGYPSGWGLNRGPVLDHVTTTSPGAGWRRGRETIVPVETTDAGASPTDDSIRALPDVSPGNDSIPARPDEAPAAVLTPLRLAALLTAIGGSVVDDDHLAVTLQRAVEIAAEAIDGASSCGVTIVLGGLTYTAVHTDDRTLEVDAHQYANGDGPCLEAARTGTIVRVDVDSADERWPDFARAAKTEGIRSFLAAPLHSHDLHLGSFNLYGTDPAAFDSVDEAVLGLLTSTVATAIGDYARVRSANEVASGLREALEHRAPIEQAKGMLMALHGCDSDTAFRMLSTQSQKENRKLRDIAREFVANVSKG